VLDRLVERFLERVEGGESAPDVLADLGEASPDVADDLRASARALEAAGLVPGAVDGDRLPDTVGPYRVTRRLGAGGMGVVYLATDEGGRRVAVKVLRADLALSGRSRARFDRELAAARALDHPGVAKVIDSGELADGVPYIVQEWVPGASLDAVLRSVQDARAVQRARGGRALSESDLFQAVRDVTPAEDRAIDAGMFGGRSWDDACLGIVRQVADALAHAHERGVVHRDVKPSNVIVDGRGRATLIDFGLARMADAATLTREGTHVGSLPYMPPEQITGEAEADARSDVYALGVTLYELLTLRRPFDSRSFEELRRLVVQGDPAPPSRVEPAVHGDTDAVCLRALERDPRRRYGDMAAFSSDLDRIASRERPVARRPGPLRRAARWARRSPARAIAASALLLGPVGWAVVAQWALQRSDAALAIEERAREDGDRQLATVLGAMRGLFTDLAEEELADAPGMQQARLQATERALGVLERLREERPDDPDVTLELYEVLRARASALSEARRYPESIALYDRATAEVDRLIEQQGRTHELRRKRADVRERREALALRGSSTPDQIVPYREAVAELDDIALDGGFAERRCAAEARLILIDLLHGAGASEEALEEARALYAATSTPQLEDPDSTSAWTPIFAAKALGTLARTEQRAGVESDFDARYGEIHRLYADALERDPEDRRARASDVTARCRHAFDASRRNEHDLAREVLEPALARARGLAADYPGIERYRALRTRAETTLAITRARAGDTVAAGEAFARIAEDAWVAMLGRPGDVQRAVQCAESWMNVAVVSIEQPPNPERALDALGRTDEALEAIDSLDPDNLTARAIRVQMDYVAALAHGGVGDAALARQHLERYDAAADRSYTSEGLRASGWAAVALATSDAEEAAKCREECIAALQRAADAGMNRPEDIESDAEIVRAVGEDPRFARILRQIVGH